LTVYVRKSHIFRMPRKLPPLNALRAFEAAGRHQSFTRAAQELGVSHSSISRHVRGLEHRLKVRLFRDLPRGVELTRDGMDYLARLTPVFDAIAEASDALEERPAGVITLNCEPVFATKWLIPALSAFKSRHPEVDIRLEASQELADVTRYATDVAIRFFNSGVPDRPAELISNAAVYPYASPDLIAGPVTSPDQLRDYPLLKDRNSDTWTRWFTLAGLDLTVAHGCRPGVGIGDCRAGGDPDVKRSGAKGCGRRTADPRFRPGISGRRLLSGAGARCVTTQGGAGFSGLAIGAKSGIAGVMGR